MKNLNNVEILPPLTVSHFEMLQTYTVNAYIYPAVVFPNIEFPSFGTGHGHACSVCAHVYITIDRGTH
jgi:hypothetical protein